MKIAIKDIYPNPFKKQIVNGELNDEKVARLIESVEKTGFWDNVLVRPHPKLPDKFELCYGHHRIEAVRRLYGDDYIVNLPVHNVDEENMLRILANENVESEEDRVQYQVDTVLAVKRYLETTRPTVGHVARPQGGGTQPKGMGARDISKWLGKENWSKSKVADLLKLHKKLDPAIVEKLTWQVKSDRSQGHGLTKTAGIELSRLGKDSSYQKPLAEIVAEHDVPKRVTQETVGILNSDDYSDRAKERTLGWLEDAYTESDQQSAIDRHQVREIADQHKEREAIEKRKSTPQKEEVKEYADLLREVADRLDKKVTTAYNELEKIDLDETIKNDINVWLIVEDFVELALKFK